jgi:signal peptidase I
VSVTVTPASTRAAQRRASPAVGTTRRRRARRRHRHRPWSWADLGHLGVDGVRLLALGWLLVLATMLTAVPVSWAFGWQPAAVVTGSMAPAIRPGDIVLAAPLPGPRVRPGQIVLARRPGFPGTLVTHRVVRIRDDGMLVTRGDANPVEDASPLAPADVVGVVRLVVPLVGRPLLVARGPSAGDLTWTGLLLAAVLLATPRPSRSRSRRRRPPALPAPVRD